MSDLGPSLTPRPVSSPDASGRVVARVSSASDNTKQQQQASGGQPQAHGEEESARSGHHDPAVTLSTTFVHLEAGATIEGAVTDRDADLRPLLEANGALYLLDATARVLERLRASQAITVKVTAIDRAITAEIITLDGQPVAAPITVTLAVVKVDSTKIITDGSAPLALQISTYRPSADYIPRPPEDETPLASLNVAPPAAAPPPISDATAESAPAPLKTPPIPTVSQSVTATPMAQGLTETAVTAPLPPKTIPLPETFQTILFPAVPGARAYTPAASGPVPVTVRITVMTPPLPGATSLAGGPTPPVAPLTAAVMATAAASETEATVLRGTVIRTAAIASPPSPSLSAAPSPSAGTEASAAPNPAPSVAPSAPSGSFVIATAAGEIALPRDITLPVGTTVELNLIRKAPHHPSAATATAAIAPASTDDAVAAPPPAAAAAAIVQATAVTEAAAPVAPLTDLLPEPMQLWPLFQALNAVLQNDAGMAAAMTSKLPAPQHFLNPALLLFMNLIGVRSPSQLFLGRDVTSSLRERGRDDIIKAFESTVERLKNVAADRSPGEWRPYPLPFLSERGPEMILLLVRNSGEDPGHDDSKNENNSGAEQPDSHRVTRFVLDVTVGSLGLTQIDGMIKGRTFNLALRSEHQLNSQEEQDLRGLFHGALERSQFSGDISFRTGLPFPVNSSAEWRTAARQVNALTA